jgi:hypothetical protein
MAACGECGAEEREEALKFAHRAGGVKVNLWIGVF